MSKVTSLGGVFVRSHDPVRLRTFYRDAFGLAIGAWGATLPIRDAAGGDPASTGAVGTRCDRNGFQVWQALPRDSAYLGSDGQAFMVNLRVDDLDSVLVRAKANGAEVLQRGGQTPQGRFGYVVDPDGTLIELWEPAPDDEHTRRLHAGAELDIRDKPGAADLAKVACQGTDVGTLTLQSLVGVSPQRVWRAWTEPETLCDWWGLAGADVDLRIGGKYALEFLADAPHGQRGSEACQVLSYVPGRMLSVTWDAPPHLPMRGELTWLTISADPTQQGLGTLLTLEHSGLGRGPQWEDYRNYLHNAWGRVLRRFAVYWQRQASTEPNEETVVDLREISTAPDANRVPEQRQSSTVPASWRLSLVESD